MPTIKDLLIYKILRVLYRWFLEPFLRLGFEIKAVIKEHYYENQLGIKTTGCYSITKDATLFNDSLPYLPIPYHVIEEILEHIRIGPDDVFVDLGCGMGRIILFMSAKKKLKRLWGVESDGVMFELAQKNLDNLKSKHTPIEIFRADAAGFDVKDGTIFFMYNPFGRKTKMAVLENIRNSLSVNPRKITLICYPARDFTMLENCDWLELETETEYAVFSVWRSK